MKRLLPLFLLCIAVLCARPAEAVRAYADGGLQSNQTFCPVTGNLVTVLQTYAGYFTDPNEPYPRAGDLAYVHALGANVSPCVNDAVGFEFFPPVGANLAISATNPVYCILGKLDGSITPFNVPNNANGSCSQTPTIGVNGGYYFGFSVLPPGWYLEMQVPVVFTQQLFGLAGPTSHRLTVATSSTYGTVFPFQPVTVYQPAAATLTVFKSGTGTVTSNSGGINCGATCSASYASGASVTLTASPAAGWRFSGWTAGPCAGSNPICTVTMNSSQSVTALFARAIGSLSVTLGGLPAGSVVTLSITGPNGYSITNNVMTGTGFNLSDVPTGTYTVTAPTTTIGLTTYNAPTQSGVVNFGTTTTINITYSSAAIPQAVKNDLSGDRKSDIVWQNTDGTVVAWLMNGLSASSTGVLLGSGSGWSIKQTGDFNGDGKSDLLWQHTDGTVVVWLMNGLVPSSTALLLGSGSGWSVKHIGDFNGDGKSDLLWQHTDGSVVAWLMNGVSASSSSLLIGPASGWSVKQIGDFNGDGKSDLYWQHTDGSTYMWLMNGLVPSGSGALLGPGSGWSVKQIGDFNGDGKSDLLWQHTDGTVVAWLMNGLSASSTGILLAAGSGWSVKQIGDFNGDGKSDLLWQNTDGTVVAWLMNGLGASSTGLMIGPGSGWSVKQIGDFNGDGKSDFFWQHTDGSTYMWLMNGLIPSSSGALLGAGSGWSPSP